VAAAFWRREKGWQLCFGFEVSDCFDRSFCEQFFVVFTVNSCSKFMKMFQEKRRIQSNQRKSIEIDSINILSEKFDSFFQQVHGEFMSKMAGMTNFV
jgi:hypothetical protein